MTGPMWAQGERDSTLHSKAPPRHLGPDRPPDDGANAAPTHPRRQQPRTPAPTPELNASQKWLAAFMDDRAFARARAAGKNETEAGHARAKAEADIALF